MAIKTTIQLRRDTLANWTSINPLLANGEVALVDKNNGVGEKLWVVRIGDGVHNFNDLPETAYALRSELTALGDEVFLSAKTYTNEVSTALSNALTAESNTRKNTDDALSAAISGKVKIENEAVDYVNFDRVNAEEYHDIITHGTIDPKTIYIVSSDNINAFGEKIINVGDATDLSDAVNLKQLNATKTELTTLVSSVSATLQSEIDDIESGASALVSSVSAELTGIINNVSTDLEGQITSVSSTLDNKIDTVNSNLTTLVNTTKEDLEARDTFISGLLNTVSTDLDALEAADLGLSTDYSEFKTQTGNNFSYISGVVDDTIEDLGELSGKVEALSTASEVGVSALGRTSDTYKYAILQGGVSKGEIEVPYDVFVDKGELSTIGDKTYLLLTLNNAASSVISIEVDSLVNVYTGLTSDTVAVNVDSFQISAAVLDGSINTTQLADNAVTTAKIADANITPAKLDPNGVFVFDCGGAANS